MAEHFHFRRIVLLACSRVRLILACAIELIIAVPPGGQVTLAQHASAACAWPDCFERQLLCKGRRIGRISQRQVWSALTLQGTDEKHDWARHAGCPRTPAPPAALAAHPSPPRTARQSL